MVYCDDSQRHQFSLCFELFMLFLVKTVMFATTNLEGKKVDDDVKDIDEVYQNYCFPSCGREQILECGCSLQWIIRQKSVPHINIAADHDIEAPQV